MPTLYLTHQGAKLRLRKGRLILESPEDEVLLELPARKVRRVLVFGNISLTSPALAFLLRRGARVFFLSQTGTFYGYAAGAAPPSPARIKKQLEVAQGPRSLDIARAIVEAKVRSQREALRRYGFKADELEPLDEVLKRIQSISNKDLLRGLEGTASRHYFRLVAKSLKDVPFEHRRKRPPKDPVNAALSYAYAVLYSLALSAVQAAELHPEIGVFHATGRRRASLALDLMEEFRVPLVDIPVFAAFRRGHLKPSHTEIGDHAVLLNDEGKKTLLQLLEERLHETPSGKKTNYLTFVFKQAERLASAIIHDKPYHAFVFGRKA